MLAKADARLLDDATVAAWLPHRSERGHKGSNGTLVCIAGSLDYAGAALLCGLAAARAGAGLVVLAVPAPIQAVFAGRVPELVTMGLPARADGRDVDARESGHALKARAPNALVIGPGLAESDGYLELAVGLIERDGPPLVVDGGALNLLSQHGDWWSAARRQCVLTPHPGEFARLTGELVTDDDAERGSRAAAAARQFGQVVVLKGAGSVIATPDGRLARSPFVNAALSTAGTGDVLAGTIGALLAQGVAPFEAAALGVYLHGAAGARIRERLGDSGLVASDLPLEIAHVRHRLGQLRDRPGAGKVGFSRR